MTTSRRAFVLAVTAATLFFAAASASPASAHEWRRGWGFHHYYGHFGHYGFGRGHYRFGWGYGRHHSCYFDGHCGFNGGYRWGYHWGGYRHVVASVVVAPVVVAPPVVVTTPACPAHTHLSRSGKFCLPNG